MIAVPNTTHDFYTNSEYDVYLLEYRGNFSEEIKKISYATGSEITNTLAIVAVKPTDLARLFKDVPSILFINFREIFVLESTVLEYSAENTSNIMSIKNNPYLNINGTGVLIGMIDTGIDYLNKEFTKEDGTTRIESIWDQTVPSKSDDANQNIFIGQTYSSIEINKALDAQRNGKDPYEIVPSVDSDGHGTQLAGVIGARGYTKKIEGVANDCNFVVVKLIESASFKEKLKKNNIPSIPIYGSGEILAGLEYLTQYALKVNKPMVILFALGSTDYTHDGNTTIARYMNEISSYKGIVIVTGTGNQGESDGHASGYIANAGDVGTSELLISREQKIFEFKVYVRRPNKLTLNVISPSGQNSGFIPAKINQRELVNYVLEDTSLYIVYFMPDDITGLEIISLYFKDIKPGIWKIQLKGTYIIDGRYDMWLEPYTTIPEGTKFLNPDPFVTLTDTSCAKKVISVAFYNQIDDSIVSKSGRGYPFNNFIKPEIAAPGVNIVTTNVGETTKVISGSGVAAAITAGCCALILQWGIVNGNDLTMFSTSLISYLISGATRRREDIYPNREWGYGKLDLLGAFKALSGMTSAKNIAGARLLMSRNKIDDKSEYYIGNLFIRNPNI